MSRLWPERLLGVLSPRHIALAKQPLLGRATGAQFSRALEGDEDDHAQVLEAFEQGLVTLSAGHSKLKPASLKLVLAGSLARYALTVPVTTLLSVEEESALARQTFVQRYGDASLSWTVRYQAQGLGDAFLASAVDNTLLDKLKTLCQTYKVELESVEPLLATAWRKSRRQLSRKASWLAVTEPGRVHLLAVHDRAWLSLASAHIHEDWEAVLATLLQREAAVLDRNVLSKNGDETVWLMGAAPGINLPAARPWRWLATPTGDTPYLDFVLG